MNRGSGLVLLPSARQPVGLFAQLRADLPDERVLAPSLTELGLDQHPLPLSRCANAVAEAMGAAGIESATVCGIGVGATLALQLAADRPELVASLVLLTRQVTLPTMLMSLPAAVLRLLPAARVQRLGADDAQVLALLDQVRGVDTRAYAARVSAAALVVCGARDRVNRHASATLARSLPEGRLHLVPRAGADWLTREPDRLTEVLRHVVRG